MLCTVQTRIAVGYHTCVPWATVKSPDVITLHCKSCDILLVPQKHKHGAVTWSTQSYIHLAIVCRYHNVYQNIHSLRISARALTVTRHSLAYSSPVNTRLSSTWSGGMGRLAAASLATWMLSCNATKSCRAWSNALPRPAWKIKHMEVIYHIITHLKSLQVFIILHQRKTLKVTKLQFS
jgi:hypothetical protein